MNPAAQQGWVKSTDPKTGRVFYANHITRKTQWEKPDNWVEEPAVLAPPPPLPAHSDNEEPLPSNWEVMHDPTTGKPFYVDHERKITTWKRPTAASSTPASYSHAPATATTTFRNLTGSASHTGHRQQHHFQPKSYEEEASYYNFASHHQSSAEAVDLSDTMPALDFAVKKVADSLRSECPHCDAVFSMSKRRHHCRLCGDVFCDACSSNRCELPLSGSEFEKPVRVCDFCHQDVERGNFFSMRRYLTPLQLFDASKYTSSRSDEDDHKFTPENVNAALDALTVDLNQMLQNPSSNSDFGDKLSILPPAVFIPALIKHISYRETSDRAIRALAALLALENVAGQHRFANSVYFYGGKETVEDILAILERSGSDRKTLFVLEQGARTIFYLTDAAIMKSLEAKRHEIIQEEEGDESDYGGEHSIDLSRTLRNMLDHSSASKNPNLQRWATSCIRNLVLEDQRRATMAVNDFAASIASGQSPDPMRYESFLDQLINTGGIMILCSLIGAEDSDTRAHATAALGATLTATRAMDASLAALSEMTGGRDGSSEQKDGQIVRAIVAGGGCGASVSQLLLSADHNVAGMGCHFVSALVTPLLSVATGNLPSQYDCQNDPDVYGAFREAALEITTGGCLPALVSLVREQGSTSRARPMDLRKAAMETLVASVHAIGEMGKAWADGKYEEGLEANHAPSKLKDAMILINEEGVSEMALQVLQSTTGQSLGSTHDTPASRLREGAAMILASLTSCSAQAIMDLQTQNIMSQLLLSSNDASMTMTSSSLRADAAPRCLGILETVSAILMFAWQHPSGASSELLDRLIEVLDAGAIDYMSKVLSVKVDWESKEKAVGGMKARTSCFRLLCCLFGIALTDETAIGMRRLMDAVDSDSHSMHYQHRSRSSRERTGPSNIIESTLQSLQVASNYARRALMGSLSVSQHYQAALMDMVEAAVLATGSMCGSSIAPGGGEGTLVKGDNFLVLRSDEFVSRRTSICAAACDVVVRGSRSGPPLVPTMLVGGFGEGTVLASLRLSLSIAQNGTKEQHAKLAMSGILVPISDILRCALTAGDLYKFSSALTLVRFCGPHVASGEGGGLQSVRDAIKVATNVLILPINPDASIEQIETQEALKSECITALESLSKNAALWKSISTEALPSMVRYLQSTGDSGVGSQRHRETRCAVLRSILQIVQVPSHAVSAAETGLVEPLGKLLKSGKSSSFRQDDGTDDEVPMLALEVLHVIAKNPESRRKARLLDIGVVRSICAAIGSAATKKARQPTDPRADITAAGLEIIHAVLNDIESNADATAVLQSPSAIAFLDAVASEPLFIRSMCASFLISTGMQIKRHDSDNDWGGGDTYDVPELYGPPLVLVKDACAGYSDTHQAAAAVLMTTAVYACAIDSRKSAAFWNACLLKDAHKTNSSADADVDQLECVQTATTLCSYFLESLDKDYKPFIPLNPRKQQDYLTILRPLVRHRLLQALHGLLSEVAIDNDDDGPADPYIVSVFVNFNIPQICLALWKDPALLDLAFGLIKQVIEMGTDDVIHLFVASKEAIISLFDLLNLDPAKTAAPNTDVNEIRKFLAGILGTLAESGMLAKAVERFDVRSSAIGALAAACLEEDKPQQHIQPPPAYPGPPHDHDEMDHHDDEDMTSNRLSSGLMKCLVELCADDKTKKIRLSSVEAGAIARNLGKKLCHMVLSRFLERAKLQQYEMEEDEEIMDAPDVAMLCAVVQHPEALKTIRSIGGLPALSQIAAEGELSAVMALKKACDEDASLLLEDDTYLCVMSLLSEEKEHASWRSDDSIRCQIEGAAFEMIGLLCRSSQRGRKAVGTSDKCNDCAAKALEAVSSFITPSADIFETDSSKPQKEAMDESDDDDSESEAGEEADAEAVPLEPPSYNDLVPVATSKNVPPSKPGELRNMEEADLGVSCFCFLSAVVQVVCVRKEMLENDRFINASSAIATKSPHPALQFEAAKLLKSLARYSARSTDAVLSAGRLANVLHSVLQCELKSPKAAPTKSPDKQSELTLNTNLLHSTAASGLQIVFDCLDGATQLEITNTAISRYSKLVKSFTAARAAAGELSRNNGGQLAVNLSLLLLFARGKVSIDEVLTKQLLSCCVHVVQWRYDPKTKMDNELSKVNWDCAVTHNLQILALTLQTIEEESCVNLTELSKTVLMLARPGKAPRKAIDVKSALKRVIDNGDAAAKISAQIVFELLF